MSDELPWLVVGGERRPRAVDAGKRGLGQPARHNASAATVQSEAAEVQIACDQQIKQVACSAAGIGRVGGVQ